MWKRPWTHHRGAEKFLRLLLPKGFQRFVWPDVSVNSSICSCGNECFQRKTVSSANLKLSVWKPERCECGDQVFFLVTSVFYDEVPVTSELMHDVQHRRETAVPGQQHPAPCLLCEIKFTGPNAGAFGPRSGDQRGSGFIPAQAVLWKSALCWTWAHRRFGSKIKFLFQTIPKNSCKDNHPHEHEACCSLPTLGGGNVCVWGGGSEKPVMANFNRTVKLKGPNPPCCWPPPALSVPLISTPSSVCRFLQRYFCNTSSSWCELQITVLLSYDGSVTPHPPGRERPKSLLASWTSVDVCRA